MSLSSGNQKAQTILPMQILALYHHVLVIQVIFSQIPAAALMFGSPLEGDGQGQQTTTDIETMVFEKCDKEAADIVHRIDGLILNYHVPLGDLESLQRRYPIAHNVLYPLCLATSITRIYMKRHPKLASHTSASTGMAATTTGIPFGQQIKDEGTQEKLDVNTSAKINGRTGNPKSVTVMPIYKLKRVLNPICSLMDAANVISTPVDEIMMASIANPAGHQLPQQPHQQGRQMPDVQPSSERYPWPENGSMFEESLVPLQVRMMTYPSSYDYRSRNNIDKEQLEKLSQNKDLRSNSSTAVTATASNSAPIPISRANSIAKVHRSMMLSRSRSVSAPSAAHVTLPVRKRGGSHASPQQHLAAQGVKRHYQSNNLNVFASDPNLAAKRVRTESIAYAGNGFDGHLLRPPHPVQIQRRISPVHSNANSTSHHHSTQGLANIQQQQQQQQQQHPHDLDSEQHQQAAALQQMYHTDFFFMMHPESAAAAAAVADDEELYLQQRRGMKAAAAAAAAAAGQMQNVPGAGEDDSVQQQQSAPQAQPPSSTPTPTSLAASIVVSSPGSASRAAARVPGSLQNDMIPAKLLPPPKQQRALPLKGGYSGVSYPTTTPVDFSESVMETLHHAHSVEPSFGPTGMVDPSMNLSMTTTAAAAAAVAAVRQNQQQQHQQQPQNQHHQATGGNSGEIMYLFGEDSRSSSQQHHQPQQQQDWIEQQSQPPQQRADKDIRHGRSSWYGRQPQQQPPVSTSPTAWANFAQLYQDHRHYGHQTTRASHSNAPGATAVAAATTGNEATVVDDSFDHDQWIMPDTTKMTEESVMNWH
ncbi:hypothetical protein BCR43DRAFT_48230 [Syncephalastrum racemosum]|uniref:Uncharacterized protein n=1 Tax=Syncephalastrum racemosum TaxID=13706 RepID=A0A1X2HV47_SYNRA|nr:hypothetical protein BCR43DRAFT_48230 [Syncephalastrum racemosum]